MTALGHGERREPRAAASGASWQPTKVAVLGCGYWGINYVRVFNELADAEISLVCDERAEALKRITRLFPHARVSTDAREALSDPTIDAVVIATQASTHHELTRAALLAGKHVLVEKPLTTDSDSSEDLVKLSREEGVLLLVGHTFLYNSAVRKVKEYVDESDVYYLYARRTSLGPIRHDVNAIWDLAPHDVSIFNYLLDGQPDWVSAVGARVLRTEREDVGFVSLGYPDNVLAHIHVSWADPNKVREVVVVGSERRIVFNDLDPLERVRVFEKGVKPMPIDPDSPVGFGEYQMQLRDGDIISPTVRASEPLKNQCGHFLHCIRRGEQPFTPAEQGRAVVRTMEAINQSIACGGVPVTVERDPE